MALSPQLLLLISLVTFGLLGWIVSLAWQQRGLRISSETSLRYTAYRQADLVIFAEGHQQLLEAQELLESSIHGTTATVRAIHLGIAAIPFGILEAIPVTRDTTKVVRGTHNLISDAVYSSISVANRAGGVLTRKGIGEINVLPNDTLESQAQLPPDNALLSKQQRAASTPISDPKAEPETLSRSQPSRASKKSARPPTDPSTQTPSSPVKK